MIDQLIRRISALQAKKKKPQKNSEKENQSFDYFFCCKSNSTSASTGTAVRISETKKTKKTNA
jgi:hypothetical protein